MSFLKGLLPVREGKEVGLGREVLNLNVGQTKL